MLRIALCHGRLSTMSKRSIVEPIPDDANLFSMEGLRNALASPRLHWALIAVAVAIRLAWYLANPAVWLDEAFLLDSFLNRPLTGLFHPLENDQAAPFGFLLVEGLMMRVFGISEYAFRFLPMAAAVVSVFLFYVIAKQRLSTPAVSVALAVFALSGPLVRYAAEIKQYSTDVAVALAILLAMIGAVGHDLTKRRVALLCLVGTVAVWCSFPAIFVLAGTGATLIIGGASQRDWRRVGRLALVVCAWAASFALYYAVSLRGVGGNIKVINWWSDAYMPFPPTSASDLNWFVRTFFDLFDDPVGIVAGGLGALAFLLGCVSLFARDRNIVFLLLSPIGFGLLASAFHKYPFASRFLLFSAPMLILFVAEGYDYVRVHAPTRLLPALFLILLLVQPFIAVCRELVRPAPERDIRPGAHYIREHYQAGDAVYAYHWASFPLRYYARRYELDLTNCVVGTTSRNDWSYYEREIRQLLGKPRVWFVFTPVEERMGGGELKFFETRLNAVGTRRDAFRDRGSTVLLYDLSGQ